MNKTTLSARITVNSEITDGNRIYDYKEVCRIFNSPVSKRSIILICGDPSNEFVFVDKDLQLLVHIEYSVSGEKLKERQASQSSIAKERFTGIPWTEERKEQMSKRLQGRKCPHNAITNKNPEKIRKTAEKHRGMKRSDDAKLKMSLAKRGKPTKNKGMLMAYDESNNRHYLPKDTILSEGWRWSANALKTLKS